MHEFVNSSIATPHYVYLQSILLGYPPAWRGAQVPESCSRELKPGFRRNGLYWLNRVRITPRAGLRSFANTPLPPFQVVLHPSTECSLRVCLTALV